MKTPEGKQQQIKSCLTCAWMNTKRSIIHPTNKVVTHKTTRYFCKEPRKKGSVETIADVKVDCKYYAENKSYEKQLHGK